MLFVTNIVFFEKKEWKRLHIQKIVVPLHRFWKEALLPRSFGEMAAWSIAAVLKTVVLRGTGGSNPSLSAKMRLWINDLQPLFLWTFLAFVCFPHKRGMYEQLWMDNEMEVGIHNLGYHSCDGIMYASLKKNVFFQCLFRIKPFLCTEKRLLLWRSW